MNSEVLSIGLSVIGTVLAGGTALLAVAKIARRIRAERRLRNDLAKEFSDRVKLNQYKHALELLSTAQENRKELEQLRSLIEEHVGRLKASYQTELFPPLHEESARGRVELLRRILSNAIQSSERAHA